MNSLSPEILCCIFKHLPSYIRARLMSVSNMWADNLLWFSANNSVFKLMYTGLFVIYNHNDISIMHENGDAHLLMRLNIIPKVTCKNYAIAQHNEDIEIINSRVHNCKTISI